MPAEVSELDKVPKSTELDGFVYAGTSPLISALADDEVVTYNNVPFQVHMTNDVQEFGAVGADKDGNLLYEFEIDVEEAI